MENYHAMLLSYPERFYDKYSWSFLIKEPKAITEKNGKIKRESINGQYFQASTIQSTSRVYIIPLLKVPITFRNAHDL